MFSLGFAASHVLLSASVLMMTHLASSAPIPCHAVDGSRFIDQRSPDVSNNAPKAHFSMPISVPAGGAKSGPRYTYTPSSPMGVVDTSEPTRPFPFPQIHPFQSSCTRPSSNPDSDSSFLDVSSSSFPIAKALPYLSGPSCVSSAQNMQSPGSLMINDNHSTRASSSWGGLLNNLFSRQRSAQAILPSYCITSDEFLQKLNPPTSSSAENNKKTVESFGAVTENPSGLAMVRAPSDLSPLPPTGWRKGIDSDAPAGLSPPPIKSVACVEDGGFYIADSWDGEPDCIWYT